MTDLTVEKDMTDRELPLLTLNGEELVSTKLTPSLLCSVVTVEVFDREGQSVAISVGTLESFTKTEHTFYIQFRHTSVLQIHINTGETYKVYL